MTLSVSSSASSSPSAMPNSPPAAHLRGAEVFVAETKRKQVKNACVGCRKACKKCDEERPCSRCVRYGIVDCVDSSRKERKKGVKRGPYKRKNAMQHPQKLRRSNKNKNSEEDDDEENGQKLFILSQICNAALVDDEVEGEEVQLKEEEIEVNTTQSIIEDEGGEDVPLDPQDPLSLLNQNAFNYNTSEIAHLDSAFTTNNNDNLNEYGFPFKNVLTHLQNNTSLMPTPPRDGAIAASGANVERVSSKIDFISQRMFTPPPF